MPRLVADELVGALRERIEAGEWVRLPPERALARHFGVARNTVRRAVGVLETEGRLSRQVGRGTFVKPRCTNDITASVTAIAGSSPADLLEVRRLLEPAAAAFAATNASMAELRAVAFAHEAAAEAKEMAAFEHWDAEFHKLIFACSRNGILTELDHLMRAVRSQAPWFELKKRAFSEERQRVLCEEHEVILEALQARDPDRARNAAEVHLATVQRNFLGL